jgi:hypothetical protein
VAIAAVVKIFSHRPEYGLQYHELEKKVLDKFFYGENTKKGVDILEK